MWKARSVGAGGSAAAATPLCWHLTQRLPPHTAAPLFRRTHHVKHRGHGRSRGHLRAWVLGRRGWAAVPWLASSPAPGRTVQRPTQHSDAAATNSCPTNSCPTWPLSQYSEPMTRAKTRPTTRRRPLYCNTQGGRQRGGTCVRSGAGAADGRSCAACKNGTAPARQRAHLRQAPVPRLLPLQQHPELRPVAGVVLAGARRRRLAHRLAGGVHRLHGARAQLAGLLGAGAGVGRQMQVGGGMGWG